MWDFWKTADESSKLWRFRGHEKGEKCLPSRSTNGSMIPERISVSSLDESPGWTCKRRELLFHSCWWWYRAIYTSVTFRYTNDRDLQWYWSRSVSKTILYFLLCLTFLGFNGVQQYVSREIPLKADTFVAGYSIGRLQTPVNTRLRTVFHSKPSLWFIRLFCVLQASPYMPAFSHVRYLLFLFAFASSCYRIVSSSFCSIHSRRERINERDLSHLVPWPVCFYRSFATRRSS